MEREDEPPFLVLSGKGETSQVVSRRPRTSAVRSPQLKGVPRRQGFDDASHGSRGPVTNIAHEICDLVGQPSIRICEALRIESTSDERISVTLDLLARLLGRNLRQRRMRLGVAPDFVSALGKFDDIGPIEAPRTPQQPARHIERAAEAP